VTLLERREAVMRIEAKMACRGMVIVSETFYPGWKASVDGHAARIYEAYGALREVVVDGGQHEIEFQYRPASVYGGGFLTALGFMASVVAAFWRSRTAS